MTVMIAPTWEGVRTELFELLDPHGPCARLSTVDGVIRAANPAAGRLFGMPVAALVGRTFVRCLTPSSVLLWETQFRPLLMMRGAVDGGFVAVRTGAGDEVPVLVAAGARHVGATLHVEVALLAARQRLAHEQALRAARDEAQAARAESDAARLALAESVARQQATEAQLRQVQKLEAVGQLAGGIAHDFNNLLAVIAGHLEQADVELAGVPQPAGALVAEELAHVRRAADRAAAVVRQLLAFSRHQVLAPSALDPAAVVREMEGLLRPLLGANVAWRVECPGPTWPVVADRGQLEQVLLNLVINARDAIRATGRPGTITVRVENHAVPGGSGQPEEWVRLTVEDSGSGMSADTLARAFEPFYTTKPVGAGSGLGLAMVYGIVQQSGGRIALASDPGSGTRVTIDLPSAVRTPGHGRPVVRGPERPATPAGAPASSRAAAGTVLVVDDDAGVRHMARRMLTRAGYAVVECENGARALAAWRARPGAIRAVVSDGRMPELDGHALRRALRAEQAELPILLVSGYAERAVDACGPCDGFLEKPFTSDGLLEALRALGVHPQSPAG
jgi:signal transduction histidine kinase